MSEAYNFYCRLMLLSFIDVFQLLLRLQDLLNKCSMILTAFGQSCHCLKVAEIILGDLKGT